MGDQCNLAPPGFLKMSLLERTLTFEVDRQFLLNLVGSGICV